MKKDYVSFYFAILCGTIFIAGMFYAKEFGFFSYKYLLSSFFTLFPMWVFYLYVKEYNKEQKQKESGKKINEFHK